MKIRNVWFFPLIASVILLTSCATSTDPADAYKGESPQFIFNKGETALYDHNYSEAIKRFEALNVQYPLGEDTETSELHVIYAYYKMSDYASAESAADRFIHLHPTSPNVDYAYYMRGLSNYYQNMGIFERLFAVNLATRDLSQIKKSYGDFADLYHLYPRSRYAPAAHQYMVYLRNILAEHELNVAQYYYGREAYVAAANRANLLVRHYQGAPTVPLALAIMTKSYRRLNLTKDANESLAVLQYNYPNSYYVREAMK